MAASPIVLTESPPASVDQEQIEGWLTAKFATDAVEFGPPDPNRIEFVYYPATTMVLYGSTPGAFCGGYHDSVRVDGLVVLYAVVADCTQPPSDVGFTIWMS